MAGDARLVATPKQDQPWSFSGAESQETWKIQVSRDHNPVLTPSDGQYFTICGAVQTDLVGVDTYMSVSLEHAQWRTGP